MSQAQHDDIPKIPLPGKLVVGGIAGLIGTCAVFPLDLSKTRLQNQVARPDGTLQYKGVLDTFRQIFKAEGRAGLYKGIVPNLVGVTPEKAIKLAANDYFRESLTGPDGTLALKHEIMAGAGAGFCQVTATNPMEIVKIRMQLQSDLPKAKQLTPMQIVRHLGVAGMYRGSLATWLRDIPYSVVFFPLYANIKKRCADPKTGVTNIPGLLFAGGFSGAFAAALVTPADVIKTRLQVRGAQYKSVPEAFSGILAKEGPSAFFKGVVPRSSVQAPLFGLALVAFELQQRWWVKYQLEKRAERNAMN